MEPKNTAPHQGPKVLAASIADTGRILGIGKNLTYDLAGAGELELVHFYGRAAITMSSIESLLARGGTQSVKKPRRNDSPQHAQQKKSV